MSLLKSLPEIKSLLKESKEKKKELNRIKRKIEKFNSEYSFINKIFAKGSESSFLEKNIQLLFKSIGYENVKHIVNNTRNEDILIRKDERLSCIEIKSTKKPAISENESFQVLKYKNRRLANDPEKKIVGILIVNSENEIQDPFKRNQKPFDKYRIQDAEINVFTIISTVELLKGFILVKKGDLSLNDFDKIIHKKGEVRFSKRKIKEKLRRM